MRSSGTILLYVNLGCEEKFHVENEIIQKRFCAKLLNEKSFFDNFFSSHTFAFIITKSSLIRVRKKRVGGGWLL